MENNRPYTLKEVADALTNEGVDLAFLAKLVKQVATQTTQVTKNLTEPLKNPRTMELEYRTDPVTGKQVPLQKVVYELGSDGRERPVTLVENHVNPKAIASVLDFVDRLIETPAKEIKHQLGITDEMRAQIEATRKMLEENPELSEALEKGLEADFEIL